MIYDLSEDQVQFRDVIETFLRKSYGDDARRDIAASDRGFSLDVWLALANDICVLGIGFSEVIGGVGGADDAQIPLMETFGKIGQGAGKKKLWHSVRVLAAHATLK